jgi:hypothetical protein
MTRQRYRTTAKSHRHRHGQVALATTSPHDQCPHSSAITSRTRQRRHQQDSTTSSPTGLSSAIGNTVVSMTQQLHHAATKLPRQRHRQRDSAVPSPAWLGIYITSWPSCLDSTVASMTRYLHCVAAKSSRRRRRQHDSTTPSLA